MKTIITAIALVAAIAGAAHAEVTMTPMDDEGQAVVVKPWEWLTPEEKIEQLRSLSTAHCFSYQRLEMRDGSPVCVEEEH